MRYVLLFRTTILLNKVYAVQSKVSFLMTLKMKYTKVTIKRDKPFMILFVMFESWTTFWYTCRLSSPRQYYLIPLSRVVRENSMIPGKIGKDSFYTLSQIHVCSANNNVVILTDICSQYILLADSMH